MEPEEPERVRGSEQRAGLSASAPFSSSGVFRRAHDSGMILFRIFIPSISFISKKTIFSKYDSKYGSYTSPE